MGKRAKLFFETNPSAMAPNGREWFVSVGVRGVTEARYIAGKVRKADDSGTHSGHCTGRYCGFAAVGKTVEAVARKIATHWRAADCQTHPA